MVLDVNAPSFGIQEAAEDTDATKEMFPGTISAQQGALYPVEAPGLGVDFDEAVARRPLRPRHWSTTGGHCCAIATAVCNVPDRGHRPGLPRGPGPGRYPRPAAPVRWFAARATASVTGSGPWATSRTSPAVTAVSRSATSTRATSSRVTSPTLRSAVMRTAPVPGSSVRAAGRQDDGIAPAQGVRHLVARSRLEVADDGLDAVGHQVLTVGGVADEPDDTVSPGGEQSAQTAGDLPVPACDGDLHELSSVPLRSVRT